MRKDHNLRQNKAQKVALVFHSLRFWGGAQYHIRKTFDALDSPTLFTSWYFSDFIKERFADIREHIKTTWMQYLPWKKVLQEEYVNLEQFAYPMLNLNKYDTILVTSDGFEKTVRIPKGKRSILVVLTPPRFLWLNTRSKVGYKRWTYKYVYEPFLKKPLNAYWRWLDRKSAQKFDEIYGISSAVNERIKKYWDREATGVLFPPVPLDQVEYNGDQESREDYCVYFGGVEEYKGIEIAVEGAILAKQKLIVYGGGQHLEAARQIVKDMDGGKYVEFTGKRYEDSDKTEFLKKAKAAILPARDEDFGITFVEALSAGCPLIAYKNGGVIDIVGDVNNIAILTEEFSGEAISQAIHDLDNLEYDPVVARKRAEYFSEENFEKRLRKIVYGDESSNH